MLHERFHSPQLNALITALGSRVNSQTAANLRTTAQANLDWVNGFEGLMLSNFLAEFAAETPLTTTAAPETTTVTAGPTTTTTTPSSAVTTTTRPTSVTTTVVQTTTEGDDGAATIGLSIAALLVSITVHLLMG